MLDNVVTLMLVLAAMLGLLIIAYLFFGFILVVFYNGFLFNLSKNAWKRSESNNIPYKNFVRLRLMQICWMTVFWLPSGVL